MHVLIVYGTRPEAIKLAPVISALRSTAGLSTTVAVTGQHREMLDQVNELFGIAPDRDLDLFRHGQTLAELTSRAVTAITELLAALTPDLVVVQGDTTTAFVAALAAFYARVPIAHVEAGLRTGDLAHPFPEEANRQLLTRIADLHLAPTALAADNLRREAAVPEAVYVTGNTVIDALLLTLATPEPGIVTELVTAAAGRRLLLATAHRRESWGAPMRDIGTALAELAGRADVHLVVPVHRNPVVRDDLLPPLAGLPNVAVVEPLAYAELCHLMRHSYLVLTDSGGIQEEAPTVGVPTLVLRETTERQEALDAGTARLVGTDPVAVVKAAGALLDDPAERAAMVAGGNPFGDGRAAERIVSAVLAFFGRGDRLPEFTFGPVR